MIRKENTLLFTYQQCEPWDVAKTAASNKRRFRDNC